MLYARIGTGMAAGNCHIHVTIDKRGLRGWGYLCYTNIAVWVSVLAAIMGKRSGVYHA